MHINQHNQGNCPFKHISLAFPVLLLTENIIIDKIGAIKPAVATMFVAAFLR
jgi:hypothetical protein